MALTNAGRGIEVYHRGIKQCCGVERAQVRKAGVMAMAMVKHTHTNVPEDIPPPGAVQAEYGDQLV